MIHTVCPIDGTDAYDEEVYPANFDPATLDSSHFSARRAPDRIHYRMVRNRRTDCLRADPILGDEDLYRLYRESRVTYDTLSNYATETYRKTFVDALPLVPDRRGVLEVGCGPGAFLSSIRGLGFERIAGVEPSREAIAKADPDVRPWIVSGVLRPNLFAPESFSAVCGFQVLDHLPDPNSALRICRDVLAPGGMTLWICHDIGAILNRLLGQRSPVIDIEHPVLYDRNTVTALFENNGLEVARVFGVANRYPLWYWAQLAPVPTTLKRIVAYFGRPFEDIALRMNLGNMGILARKPT